jgi:NADH-quinone oxidoreductase subunit H
VHADLRDHPFAPGLGVADLNIGVLFFLAVSSLEIVGLFMGGWGSHNKYALLSAMRAVNQIIAYDLPFVFVALIPVVLAGSLQMSTIVAAQSGLSRLVRLLPGPRAAGLRRLPGRHAGRREPGAVRHPGGGVRAGGRLPRRVQRDEVRAHPAGRVRAHDRHVVPGARLLSWAAGWAGPEWLGPLWFLIKAMFVFLVVTWVRWSFVRIRVDQILAISWKLLLPISLVLLLATAFVVAYRSAGVA